METIFVVKVAAWSPKSQQEIERTGASAQSLDEAEERARQTLRDSETETKDHVTVVARHKQKIKGVL